MTDSETPPVFLIDSSPTLLLLEKTLLARRGWRIESAGSIGEASALLARDTPSLILSAEKLPDGDGLELCRRLRSDDRTREVPFLFVMGRHDESAVRACRDAGASDILFKPLRISDVDLTINRILGLAIRKWKRREFHTLVELRIGGAAVVFQAADLSPDGIALADDGLAPSMPIGLPVLLRFCVPTSPETVRAEARVLWRREVDGFIRYGLRFERLYGNSAERIAAWGGFRIEPADA